MAETIEIKLPETTPDVEESLVVFWHRQEGDRVKKGEVLVEVQTEKAVFEVEAPASGLLRKILVKRGEVAAVGDVLAIIEEPETEVGQAESQAAASIAEAAVTDDEATATDAKAVATESRREAGGVDRPTVQASPRVRRLAKELGVDLAAVAGTGPGGRVTEDDVRHAANPADAAVPGCASDGDLVEPTAIRRTIARRMLQSLQQSAQLTLNAWADVTRLAGRRKQLEQSVGWTALILRAVVVALQKHPYMNAAWDEQGIRQFRSVHLGVAADTEHGLLVPVIRNAERLSLSELEEAVNQIAIKAREGKLTAAELSGSTFTVSNLGPYGIQFFTPILNPPEAAILGVGQTESQPVLQDGRLIQRERLPLSLTFDHRVTDGAPAARFLQTMIRLLDNPDELF